MLLMAGYGGKVWQLGRLTSVLLEAGYNVTAIDYDDIVLSSGDPQMLLDLTEEVCQQARRTLEQYKLPVLCVGFSLGALLSLNVMRRDTAFRRGVWITGGDIVKVAQRLYGKKVWPQPYAELASAWRTVNMYSDPPLHDVSAVMILPTHDRLIDPDDVRSEVAKQQQDASNNITLIEHNRYRLTGLKGAHVGTIVEESVLFPERVLKYIKMLDKPA